LAGALTWPNAVGKGGRGNNKIKAETGERKGRELRR